MHRRRETARVRQHQLAHVLARDANDFRHVSEPHEVRRRLDDEGTDVETGPGSIGLANTSRRIRLTFGRDYGLTVESEPGKGTCFTVRLPRTLPTDPKGEDDVQAAA